MATLHPNNRGGSIASGNYRKPKDVKRALDRRYRERKRQKLAGLKADVLATAPELTEEGASEFIKIVSAGVPHLEALAFFVEARVWGLLTPQTRRDWLSAWLASPLMSVAAENKNRGRWQELSDDERGEIALAHATNQMAHYLYTRSYHDVGGADLKKWSDAREALQGRVDARKGGGQGAYDKFLAGILANASLAGPPQLAKAIAVPVPIAPPAPMRES